MTADEFRAELRQLFRAFPGLWDWLQSTADPAGTQEVWRKCLEGYSATEVALVVERWSTGQLEAFKAYERDHVHLMLRAVIEGDRLKALKSERQDSDREYWRDESRRRNRTGGVAEGLAETLSCAGKDVARAFRDLHPVWATVQTGEIDREAYEARKQTVFARCLESPQGETWAG